MRPVDGVSLRRTRWRILAQNALLLLVCLAISGGVVLFVVIQSQTQLLDEYLPEAIAAKHEGRPIDLRSTGDEGLLAAGLETAVLRRGEVSRDPGMPAGLPDRALMEQVLQTGEPVRQTVRIGPHTYELLTQKIDADVYQAEFSLDEQIQERGRVLRALAIAGGVGLVLSTLIAAWLAARTVRPMSDALARQRRFVADAGHELRTPLTLLSTRAQLLRRRILAAVPVGARSAELGSAEAVDLPADILVRDLDGILADTRALGAILEELLAAADTRQPLPQAPVDLSELAGQAVESAQATAADRAITLHLRPVDPVTLAAGDPTALKRALTALIDNALGHARSEVAVVVSRERSGAALTVTDDGPGISEESMPRLFDRFASNRDQARPGEQRHYGLGLMLVSEIAARHGGQVSATNRPAPQTGAVLRITLPVQR